MMSYRDEKRTYTAVFAGLLALLILSVGLAQFDFGAWNTALAIGISGAKAALIAMFFMHVRGSSGLTKVTAAAGLLWLTFMFVLTLADYRTRGWETGNVRGFYEQTLDRAELREATSGETKEP
jgi:cytochrome c oxidase subunit 4